MFLIYLLVTTLILLLCGSFFGAPWVPTRKVDFARIDKLSNLRSGQTLYDLGCGCGGLMFYLAKIHSDSKLVGIEIAPLPYLYSKIRSFFYKNVDVKFGDLKYYDLSKAQVVYIFLMPKTLNKIRTKLIRELPPDAKIITSCWGFDFTKEDIIDEHDKQVDYFVYTAGEILG